MDDEMVKRVADAIRAKCRTADPDMDDMARVAIAAVLEWRAMETAPRDGTEILLACRYISGSTSVEKGRWDSDKECWTDRWQMLPAMRWMPMPEFSVPAGAEGSEDG